MASVNGAGIVIIATNSEVITAIDAVASVNCAGIAVITIYRCIRALFIFAKINGTCIEVITIIVSDAAWNSYGHTLARCRITFTVVRANNRVSRQTVARGWIARFQSIAGDSVITVYIFAQVARLLIARLTFL